MTLEKTILKRLGEMTRLLLALTDNAAAVNRRLDRIEDRLGQIEQQLDRVEIRLDRLELSRAD